jgi:hypothetical protein
VDVTDAAVVESKKVHELFQIPGPTTRRPIPTKGDATVWDCGISIHRVCAGNSSLVLLQRDVGVTLAHGVALQTSSRSRPRRRGSRGGEWSPDR